MLLTLWLRLTGGETRCPRGRFFASLAAAYALFLALLPPFTHSLLRVGQHEALAPWSPWSDCLFIAGMVLGSLALLLAFLPMPPLALLGEEGSMAVAYRQLQGKGNAAVELLQPVGLNWVLFALCTLALLACAAVIFGLAWRRLADTGRSPLFLLLGLTYVLAFGSDGLAAGALGAHMLGPLWLAILFCQRSRERQEFAIFREPEA